jgi:hypothetical protein
MDFKTFALKTLKKYNRVQREVQKIWENYSTGLYDQASWQENSEVENEYEADADEIGPYISSRQVEKAI